MYNTKLIISWRLKLILQSVAVKLINTETNSTKSFNFFGLPLYKEDNARGVHFAFITMSGVRAQQRAEV